ncbi:MAG: hypothetical protein SV377_00480 [Halobacteria archaeon]|nr:hypothetical protein [Halobacteria archaeon]
MATKMNTDMSVTETKRGIGFDISSFTSFHWLAISFALITGSVHLYLGVTQEFLPFLLAGAGFYGAVFLMVMNVQRKILYLLGIPYTAVQIVMWAYMGMPDFEIGVVDKTIQLMLIALLAVLYLRER